MITARERVLALRILEKQEKDPKYARKIGVLVTVKRNVKYRQGEVERCLK